MRQRRGAEPGPRDVMRDSTFSQGIHPLLRQVFGKQAGDPVCVRVGEGAHEQIPTTSSEQAYPSAPLRHGRTFGTSQLRRPHATPPSALRGFLSNLDLARCFPSSAKMQPPEKPVPLRDAGGHARRCNRCRNQPGTSSECEHAHNTILRLYPREMKAFCVENVSTHKSVCPDVCSSVTHNSQKVEAAHTSAGG